MLAATISGPEIKLLRTHPHGARRLTGLTLWLAASSRASAIKRISTKSPIGQRFSPSSRRLTCTLARIPEVDHSCAGLSSADAIKERHVVPALCNRNQSWRSTMDRLPGRQSQPAYRQCGQCSSLADPGEYQAGLLELQIRSVQ